MLVNKRTIYLNNVYKIEPYGNGTAFTSFATTSSDSEPVYYDGRDLEALIKQHRAAKIDQYIKEISNVIFRDEFIDGEISVSEEFMDSVSESGDIDYVKEALMRLYLSNYQDPHLLSGILIMISSIPYEISEPHGPTMALGLLSHKSLEVRDKAIQCYERWNSKKGLTALKNIQCEPMWLQKYVEKVIWYIEEDGLD